MKYVTMLFTFILGALAAHEGYDTIAAVYAAAILVMAYMENLFRGLKK